MSPLPVVTALGDLLSVVMKLYNRKHKILRSGQQSDSYLLRKIKIMTADLEFILTTIDSFE